MAKAVNVNPRNAGLKVSTRRLALIAPSNYPNSLTATDAQREYGFISLPTGLMENEDEGDFIW